MSTSQNGWQALQSNSSLLHKWVIPGANRYFVLRQGAAGFLLCHLILWYHETIHRLDEKGSVWDEWAYAFRDVRGADDLSNHASGTAVDLNATRYPLGTTNMLSWRKVKIRARMAFYGFCIRWGGSYEGRKDEMHFEINRSLSFCEKVARRLMDTPRGKRILQANPGQARVIRS